MKHFFFSCIKITNLSLLAQINIHFYSLFKLNCTSQFNFIDFLTFLQLIFHFSRFPLRATTKLRKSIKVFRLSSENRWKFSFVIECGYFFLHRISISTLLWIVTKIFLKKWEEKNYEKLKVTYRHENFFFSFVWWVHVVRRREKVINCKKMVENSQFSA